MSKIEVNTVEPQCGTTLTLGKSGDTVTLASGASQTGFGRTGTVDWQTTPKTATFTAASGEGYFANTTTALCCLVKQPLKLERQHLLLRYYLNPTSASSYLSNHLLKL